MDELDHLVKALTPKPEQEFFTIHLPSGNFVLVYDDQLVIHQYTKDKKEDNSNEGD